ncbi:hypothetical protein BS17DRAFT_678346, partial [Gyrodon lividus]
IKKACKQIYKDGKSISSKHVADLLKGQSLTPTWNTFSESFSENVFSFFLLFIVNLLHKFELRVWKTIFMHLMHILHAGGGLSRNSTADTKKVPMFGHRTIRRFHKNASAMKRLSAHDFEDLLQ